MARRKSPPRENHDRWLISYADLLTLLLAFFVVMFASVQTNNVRAKQLSHAVQKALRADTAPSPVAPPPSKQPGKQGLTAAERLLRSNLQAELTAGAVEIHSEQRGLVVSLNSAIFFSQGGDTIDPQLYGTFVRVANILNGLPNALRFEGHTDSTPISNTRFPSNWELSAARAIAMLRLFNERFNVARERLAIVGYADIAALGSDDNPTGRRRNRRVDIVILNEPAP